MGWHAARKLRRSLDALADVLAIELLAGARALALRAPLVGSPATEAVVERVNARDRRPGPRPRGWPRRSPRSARSVRSGGELLDAARRARSS